MLRLLDEVLPVGSRGVLLFTESATSELIEGMCFRDARGREHVIARVDRQEDITTLLIEGVETAYFERLFRDVRIDATAFELIKQS